MKFVAISFGAFALFAPAVGWSQATQSYSYDANGRLTGVVTSGGAETHTSSYGYDAANNRTSRSQTGTAAWAAVSRLPINRLLQPDEALVSPDGRYTFALRPSGLMELWLGDAQDESDASALVSAFRLTDEGQARFVPSVPAAATLDGAWVSLSNDGDLALSVEGEGKLWLSGDVTASEAGQ